MDGLTDHLWEIKNYVTLIEAKRPGLGKLRSLHRVSAGDFKVTHYPRVRTL